MLSSADEVKRDYFQSVEALLHRMLKEAFREPKMAQDVDKPNWFTVLWRRVSQQIQEGTLSPTPVRIDKGMMAQELYRNLPEEQRASSDGTSVEVVERWAEAADGLSVAYLLMDGYFRAQSELAFLSWKEDDQRFKTWKELTQNHTIRPGLTQTIKWFTQVAIWCDFPEKAPSYFELDIWEPEWQEVSQMSFWAFPRPAAHLVLRDYFVSAGMLNNHLDDSYQSEAFYKLAKEHHKFLLDNIQKIQLDHFPADPQPAD